jgi:hypothetical protein
MDKQSPLIEWTVVKDDAEWEALCSELPPDEMTAANGRLHLKHFLWGMAALVLLLAGAGGWWWRPAQPGLPQPLAEIRTTAQQEVDEEAHSNDALRGRARTLKSAYFVFHFRQKDAPAVITVVPRLDGLYLTLQRTFGLAIQSDAEKLVIDVRVTQPPGQTASWHTMPGRFIVSSPAVYRAPVELTDAEILAQSIALPLLTYTLAQARERHQITPAWHPMLSGLHLWQLWNLDLPLATWRAEMVQWLYLDLPASLPGQPVALPENYSELCEMHMLWMSSPVQLEIPLVCSELDAKGWLFPLWHPRNPLTRLDQLAVPLRPDEYNEKPGSLHRVRHPGQTVALATLIEYAAVTYGRDRLPVLVATVGRPFCRRSLACRLQSSRPAGRRTWRRTMPTNWADLFLRRQAIDSGDELLQRIRGQGMVDSLRQTWQDIDLVDALGSPCERPTVRHNSQKQDYIAGRFSCNTEGGRCNIDCCKFVRHTFHITPGLSRLAGDAFKLATRPKAVTRSGLYWAAR